MSRAHEVTLKIFEEYADRIVYGREDEDEALQNAINVALPELSDEARADIFAAVYDKWQSVEITARMFATERILKEKGIV